jgi:hypothetical protein
MEQQKHYSRFSEKPNGVSAGQSVGSKAADLIHDGKALGAVVGDKIEKAGANAAQKTDSALASVGEGMNALAGTIRANAPADGMLGTAAASVAESLHSGGDYLSKKGLGEMGKDLTEVIRKHPMASLWVGLGVGVLLGSVLSRKQ